MTRPLGPLELEDVVLREAVLLIATAPIWLTQLAWRCVAGSWNDWRQGL
jgi:hypothetical protein